MSDIKLTPTLKKALILAKKTRLNAYAPYSHFQVGAALKFKSSSKLYTGCNFENVSYGATICAERNALGYAIGEGVLKKKKNNSLEFVLVVTNTSTATPPCGLCLQALNEFADSDTVVYLATTTKIILSAKFKDFLPSPFQKIEIL